MTIIHGKEAKMEFEGEKQFKSIKIWNSSGKN